MPQDVNDSLSPESVWEILNAGVVKREYSGPGALGDVKALKLGLTHHAAGVCRLATRRVKIHHLGHPWQDSVKGWSTEKIHLLFRAHFFCPASPRRTCPTVLLQQTRAFLGLLRSSSSLPPVMFTQRLQRSLKIKHK